MLWNFVQILLGWYAVDLASGIYHLILDRFGYPSTPIWGPQIKDFRLHHLFPKRILTFPWHKDATVASVIASIPVFALSFLLPYFMIPFAIGVALNHETHKAAHRDSNPAWIRWLQRWRIFLPKRVHLRHHQDFDFDYGVVNGWSHGLLNSLVRMMRPILPAPKTLL